MNNSLFNKLKKDFSGYLLHHLDKTQNKIILFYFKRINHLKCRIKHIKIGIDTNFIGNPIIKRYPESKIEIGDKVSIRSGRFTYQYPQKSVIRTRTHGAIIKIGNNCGLNGVLLSAAESIVIGNNVLLGYSTSIIDYDAHNIYNHSKRGTIRQVKIADNVFVGMNCVILKGVTIGENSVIGANSIVTKDIPANVVAAGNPCKVLKEIKK